MGASILKHFATLEDPRIEACSTSAPDRWTSRWLLGPPLLVAGRVDRLIR